MAHYGQHSQQPSYGQYPPQQYADPDGAEFNPYNNNFETQQPYNQGRYDYHDNPYGGGYTDDPTGQPVSKEQDKSVFEQEEYAAPTARGPRTSKALRRWRYEHQGNLWTKGGRGRCFGRFFCCTIMIFVFLFVAIILSLALWLRPPDIEVGGLTESASGSTFQVQNDGVSFNGGVNISVNNPNIFSVKFDEIKADVFYPLNTTRFGGGSLKDLTIKANQRTEFTFPFTLNYTDSIDPNGAILSDIMTKCGGNKANNLKVDYTISLDFKVIVIPIKPTINNNIAIPCSLLIDGLGAPSAVVEAGWVAFSITFSRP
ncbi:unnamed protein product [Somion occarium]|uniref:Late embryogenesis abundant protein LEA-2 subgroup domain-containing protein n=1 Tax=Somion occarium TaxID=3059160 RepID=A0ABP1DA74_9APHY